MSAAPRRSASTEIRARRAGRILVAAAWVACSGAPGPAIVHDAAGLLAEDEREHLERVHGLLLRDHDLDYRVELVSGVGPIDRYAHARFAELGVGGRSAAGRGLLLVVDAGGDALRMEVGRSLEAVFPDAFVAHLEQRQMVPYFRDGQVGPGVLATTELLVTRIQEARQRSAWQAGPGARAGSAGGGARSAARLGAGRDETFARGRQVEAGSRPEQTVRAYLEAMAVRNGNPELELYSEASRAMLRRRVITPGQMDALARAYRGCRAEPARLDAAGRRAVVRYPPQARLCAPFLLVRERGAWRLDFETAARAIRFGRGNAWRLDRGHAGPYAFAFDDWDLDGRGFPIRAGSYPGPR